MFLLIVVVSYENFKIFCKLKDHDDLNTFSANSRNRNLHFPDGPLIVSTSAILGWHIIVSNITTVLNLAMCYINGLNPFQQ